MKLLSLKARKTIISFSFKSSLNERLKAIFKFQVPVLNMVGSYSPFVEETVVLNGKINPENSNWMKIQVLTYF